LQHLGHIQFQRQGSNGQPDGHRQHPGRNADSFAFGELARALLLPTYKAE
jgi:hypothetical protein